MVISLNPQINFFETQENNTKDATGKTIRKYIENSKSDDDRPDSIPVGFDGKILWSNMSKSVDALTQFENGAWASKSYIFNEVTKEVEVQTLQSDGKGNGITGGRYLPKLNKDYVDSKELFLL